jgi:hydrogenase nickel incorporation protein HypA/HybF
MHEFALAQDIFDSISRNVNNQWEKVTAIFIDVGEVSGVVADSLQFGLEVVLKDKNLSHIKIEMAVVPATAVCQCGCQYPIKDFLETCPECNSYQRHITSGANVIIRSIELQE